MAELKITPIPCLEDNYAYLLEDARSGNTAVIDPSEYAPVNALLSRKKIQLDYILNTHHHWDHVGGNLELKQATGAKIVGNRADASRIPGIDIEVKDGDSFLLGSSAATVIGANGHTQGHILFWFEADGALFSGDTLFTLGCGRLFEGSAAQMWESLSRIRKLPTTTHIYCGHEYAQQNAEFAQTIEPDNQQLEERLAWVTTQRQKGLPTVPSSLKDELATNPFLRADNQELKTAMGLEKSSPETVFAEIRNRKDNF